jgi:ATP-dependent Clp protease ATP-binding subunit ClpC
VFERFTERARQVVVLAQEEARQLRHGYIGTEHVLLGLLREEEGVAALVLESLDVTLERARSAVVSLVGQGNDVASGQIPFTPRGKKALEGALRESLSLGHRYIGTEHILLGLLRDPEAVAMRVLAELEVDPDRVRVGVMRAVPDHSTAAGAIASGRLGPPPRTSVAPRQDAGEMFTRIERHIRAFLGREPDNGDLLVILSALPEGVVARTLDELGIDAAALDAALARAREAGPDDIDDQIERVRELKDAAIDQGRMQDAARHREEERRLAEAREADLLGRIRERLGLLPPETTTSQ